MSLTTKTLEDIVYNLPRGPAVDRGRVAQAAQTIARAEVPHAALAAHPAEIRTAMRLRAGVRKRRRLVVKDSAGQKLAYVYFEDEPGPPLNGQAAE
jgi:hypothetical protein